MKQDIIIIRYGHREVRDYRVSGHCALVSRALGASKIIICGEKDESILKTIRGVNERWGGQFAPEFCQNWHEATKRLKKKGYKIAHLTMYGQPIKKVEKEIQKLQKIAVIIGSQKVERGVYETADYNISIGKQPHSEIAALAIFLDRVQKGKELEKKFGGAKIRIIPQERGKKVINTKIKLVDKKIPTLKKDSE